MNRLRTEFPTKNITCSLFDKCSGCSLAENVDFPPIWQTLKNFFSKQNISPSLVVKEIVHYRSKVKLAVRGSSYSPQIGLFLEGTHEVLDIPSCPLHYPVMDEVCSLIRKKIQEHHIKPYEEKGCTGQIRYIQMMVERKTNKVQLSLMFNKTSLDSLEKAFIEDLYKSFSSFHSIWVNFVPGSTNTIVGDVWQLLYGEKEFWQQILGIEFNFHPSCFCQAHLSVFEEMLLYIDFLVPEGKNILELYSGVGPIGLYLAQKSNNVIFVESSKMAEECFKKTLSKLGVDISLKCKFFSSSVENVDLLSQDIDLLIVDPPRKGLSKSCKEKIYDIKPKEIVYISCGPTSFMRDAEEILKKGWVLQDARGFLLFPGTDHAEIIVKFVKSS